jgi:hypothetical protein
MPEGKPPPLPRSPLRPIEPFRPPVASPDALFVLFAPMDYTYSEPTVVREALVSFDRGRPTAFKVHSSGRDRASPTRR